MDPFIAAMISRQSESPNPVPERLEVWNGANRLSWLAGATPGPLSVMSIIRICSVFDVLNPDFPDWHDDCFSW